MTGSWNPARDSNAGIGTGDFDYHPDAVVDEDLAAFNAGAVAADQLPTAGHDQPQEASGYSYPTPRPGGGLGF
jgi:hypothetical protein